MDISYRRYLLINKINDFIKPYKLKYTTLLESTLWFMLYLMDSYNDKDMLKDILYVRLRTKNVVPNDTELRSIIDQYFKLYYEDIKIPELNVGKITELNDNYLFVKINDNIIKIPKCVYNIYKNITSDEEIIKLTLFYNYYENEVYNPNPDIIASIIEKIKPTLSLSLSLKLLKKKKVER